MSRTKRKPYTKSKAFDTSCRNHGGCPWCEGNRTIATQKILEIFKDPELKNELLSKAREVINLEDKYSECGNCDWKGIPEVELRDIDDLQERISPGGIVPSGLCPECGALCYPEDSLNCR